MAANRKRQDSIQIRAGSRTYFFDIAKTQDNGRAYLRITESRFKGQDGGHTKSTIVVFPEDAREFAGALRDSVRKLT